jgi:quercetin dioxygenase-like cupin family protein
MSPVDRKSMVVFYGRDAEPLDSDRMPIEGMDEGVRAGLAKLPSADVEQGAGEKSVVLFSEPGDQGLSLVYLWLKSGYVLPRHSHDADCLYYVLGGELRMGSHVLRKGDGMFIPCDQAYGYEAGPEGVEVLEFRNATRFNFVFKANDEAWWERMAATYRDRAAIWAKELVPPSDR